MKRPPAGITDPRREISKNWSTRDAKIAWWYRSYQCFHTIGESFEPLRTAFEAILGGGPILCILAVASLHWVFQCKIYHWFQVENFEIFRNFHFVPKSSRIDLGTSQGCFGVVSCILRPSVTSQHSQSTKKTPGGRIFKARYLEI